MILTALAMPRERSDVALGWADYRAGAFRRRRDLAARTLVDDRDDLGILWRKFWIGHPDGDGKQALSRFERSFECLNWIERQAPCRELAPVAQSPAAR